MLCGVFNRCASKMFAKRAKWVEVKKWKRKCSLNNAGPVNTQMFFSRVHDPGWLDPQLQNRR